MPEVLIIGETGFLSKAMLEALPTGRARGISWRQALDVDQWGDARWIVNGALDPRAKSELIEEEDDFDLKIAHLAAAAGRKYLMLSTRKAYADSVQQGAREDDLLAGLDAYGQNKARTEARLQAVLPKEQLLIVRIANVIGPELQEGRRSFMAMMLRGLLERDEISFDMSPFVRRDFITATFFADAIKGLIEADAECVVNIGSGKPIMTGELAMWLLEGFGKGSFRVTNPRVFDEFWLDVERLRSLTGLEADVESVQELCRQEGRKLASG